MGKCPLCTPYGLVFIIIGFILMFSPIPYAQWIGIVFIILAYLVPNIFSGSCNIDNSDDTCGKSEKSDQNKNIK